MFSFITEPHIEPQRQPLKVLIKDIANPQRTGQGNGAASQTWVAVSTKMFEVLKQRGLLDEMYIMVSKEKLELTGFAFVDNSDMFVYL